MVKSVGGKVVRAAVAVAVLAGSVALPYAIEVPLTIVLGVGAVIACLLWLRLLLTLPWNLYFRARSVLAEIAVSRDEGLVISQARDDEAARIARMTLGAAVAGHAVTALLVLAATLVLGGRAGYWVAAFYLLSTFFRPAGAYFAQLRFLRLLRADHGSGVVRPLLPVSGGVRPPPPARSHPVSSLSTRMPRTE
ncbi:hypothetical protein OG599_01505 [Streptomyces sp. NBC_01335]|uniref:hypothetical protein n=1 Tax=Streptomyces sp. NBC_01335 TaxID=2903828 RepID=UPI002E135484|nr:hypothetical protein OG599_01505 [Streptomyces sp. NBC_01335]